MEVGVYYFSATGNTLAGLLMLKQALEELGHACELVPVEKACGLSGQHDLLGFASPVFYGQPAKVLTDFIRRLPRQEKPRPAFIALCSGVKGSALGSREILMDLLANKNIWVLAELAFVGEESHPLLRRLRYYTPGYGGDGRPDARDKAVMRRFAEKLIGLYGAFSSGKPTTLPYRSALKCLSLLGGSLMPLLNRSLFAKTVDVDKCTKCGLCALLCPVDAISLSEAGPVFHASCTGCLRCVNLCPEGAIGLRASEKLDRYNRRVPLLREAITLPTRR